MKYISVSISRRCPHHRPLRALRSSSNGKTVGFRYVQLTPRLCPEGAGTQPKNVINISGDRCRWFFLLSGTSALGELCVYVTSGHDRAANARPATAR